MNQKSEDLSMLMRLLTENLNSKSVIKIKKIVMCLVVKLFKTLKSDILKIYLISNTFFFDIFKKKGSIFISLLNKNFYFLSIIHYIIRLIM